MWILVLCFAPPTNEIDADLIYTCTIPKFVSTIKDKKIVVTLYLLALPKET